jgi:hypothetical protein
MALLNFDGQEFAQMKRVETAVIQTLLPFRDDGKTEAALVVFALLRCARVMLRLYPEQTQRELLQALVPYLEGKTGPAEDATSGFLLN